MSIYKKINEFNKSVGAVKKNATNPYHKSKYATLENVMEVIAGPLEKCKIDYIQIPLENGLKTIIFDLETDEKLEGYIPYVGAVDMQKLGSAITYARRYALVSMFGLEQEDDDGNIASNKTQQTKPQQQPKAEKPLNKNNTLAEVIQLAGVKNIPIENICKGYKLNKLEEATQSQLNEIYGYLLKK